MKKRKAIMTPTRKEEQLDNEVSHRYEQVTHRFEKEGSLIIQREMDPSVLDNKRRQQVLVEGLRRLQDSLRGPEDLLDRANYSRPFPPAPPRHDGRYAGEAERHIEDPFAPPQIG
jgi:hypothetical protein